VRFHTKILKAGKTATGIQIPNEVVENFGSSKRPPIRITINGQTYRTTVAVMGGNLWSESARRTARKPESLEVMRWM